MAAVIAFDTHLKHSLRRLLLPDFHILLMVYLEEFSDFDTWYSDFNTWHRNHTCLILLRGEEQ